MGPTSDMGTNPQFANPDVFLGGNSYASRMLFTSDSSVASEGFHVDDFVHFGVSRVTDYTVDMQCDNPLNGYTVAPNQMASLYCTLTNNGYSPATIRLQTNVTNDSWMVPLPRHSDGHRRKQQPRNQRDHAPARSGEDHRVLGQPHGSCRFRRPAHKLGIFGSRMPAAPKPARKHGWHGPRRQPTIQRGLDLHRSSGRSAVIEPGETVW